MNRNTCITALGLLIVTQAACDSAPGPPPSAQRPPTLADFSLAPQRVVYNLLQDDAIIGDSIRFMLNLGVTVQNSGVPIEAVYWTVQAPAQGIDSVASGTLPAVSGTRYENSVMLTLSATAVQTYSVLVYAVDTAQRLSGVARGALEYVRVYEPGQPPVLEKLIVPDTLQRPTAGQPAKSLPFIARASDPDGLLDIENVEFWNADAPGRRLVMCDDGSRRPCGTSLESGDMQAGDSLFTRTVFVTSDNALGTNTFLFQVVDRAGLRSAETRHVLVIVE